MLTAKEGEEEKKNSLARVDLASLEIQIQIIFSLIFFGAQKLKRQPGLLFHTIALL